MNAAPATMPARSSSAPAFAASTGMETHVNVQAAHTRNTMRDTFTSAPCPILRDAFGSSTVSLTGTSLFAERRRRKPEIKGITAT